MNCPFITCWFSIFIYKDNIFIVFRITIGASGVHQKIYSDRREKYFASINRKRCGSFSVSDHFGAFECGDSGIFIKFSRSETVGIRRLKVEIYILKRLQSIETFFLGYVFVVFVHFISKAIHFNLFILLIVSPCLVSQFEVILVLLNTVFLISFINCLILFLAFDFDQFSYWVG